eukprot:CAMPEP_0119354150 /NCGR_PEP_ID=MMETSP1334-20130426/3196_1 /TAXON_ID=127549 /ORGANISM="Calcidiscus leptoporus, Strain RCC1130" /LENGTH=56 /DNA_ID=CAMNT_0007367627 /DNA_START=664 /DNA_END=834 /DNA_ORIENTATION=+
MQVDGVLAKTFNELFVREQSVVVHIEGAEELDDELIGRAQVEEDECRAEIVEVERA